MSWRPISTMPDKKTALTRINDAGGVRNEQPLTRRGNLFWVGSKPDVYVYYAPTEWFDSGDWR